MRTLELEFASEAATIMMQFAPLHDSGLGALYAERVGSCNSMG